MSTSLDHLPADKREFLGRAVATIRAEVPEAGMIILYGSHTRGALPHNPQNGYRSDFDLLVVVDGGGPMATEEAPHLFNLLRRAYIEARYSKSYRITAPQLAALGER